MLEAVGLDRDATLGPRAIKRDTGRSGTGRPTAESSSLEEPCQLDLEPGLEGPPLERRENGTERSRAWSRTELSLHALQRVDGREAEPTCRLERGFQRFVVKTDRNIEQCPRGGGARDSIDDPDVVRRKRNDAMNGEIGVVRPAAVGRGHAHVQFVRPNAVEMQPRSRRRVGNRTAPPEPQRCGHRPLPRRRHRAHHAVNAGIHELEPTAVTRYSIWCLVIPSSRS